MLLFPTCPLDVLRDSSHLCSIPTLSMCTKPFHFTSLESVNWTVWQLQSNGDCGSCCQCPVCTNERPRWRDGVSRHSAHGPCSIVWENPWKACVQTSLQVLANHRSDHKELGHSSGGDTPSGSEAPLKRRKGSSLLNMQCCHLQMFPLVKTSTCLRLQPVTVRSI